MVHWLLILWSSHLLIDILNKNSACLVCAKSFGFHTNGDKQMTGMKDFRFQVAST